MGNKLNEELKRVVDCLDDIETINKKLIRLKPVSKEFYETKRVLLMLNNQLERYEYNLKEQAKKYHTKKIK